MAFASGMDFSHLSPKANISMSLLASVGAMSFVIILAICAVSPSTLLAIELLLDLRVFQLRDSVMPSSTTLSLVTVTVSLVLSLAGAVLLVPCTTGSVVNFGLLPGGALFIILFTLAWMKIIVKYRV